MEKAADAFRTISEVADDLLLPQHVLRFWETRFPQIRPLKRAGGRRYYRPGDVTLLRAIRQLLYDDGYTIKGVQRLLKEQGAKGLGASARAPEDRNEANHLLLPEDPGADRLLDPVAAEPAELELPAGGQQTAAVGVLHREAIEDAIATMEDCRRLIADALKVRG